MSEPRGSAPDVSGTDVSADPDDLETGELPATSDPEQMTDEGELGGTGGGNAGGAG